MRRVVAGHLPELTLILLTVVAWGGILLAADSLFWDDWVLANGDTLSMTRDLGIPWIGPYIVAFFAIGPWMFKAVMIAATAVTAVATYRIGGHGLGLDRTARWFIAALVTVLPLNVARAALASLSFYTISLAVFMIAWAVLVSGGVRPLTERNASWWRPVLAALLFFASFTTASLLPFVALPVLHLAVLTFTRAAGFWRSVLRFVVRYWVVLAAPVAFWVVRTVFFKPTALYDGYNSFLSLRPVTPAVIAALLLGAAILGAVLVLVMTALTRRGGLPDGRFAAPATVACALGVAAVGAFIWFSGGQGITLRLTIAIPLAVSAVIVIVALVVGRTRSGESSPPLVPLLAVGILTFAVGTLPYLLVGKIPAFVGWDSRHQLLMPFGIAVLLYGGYRALAIAGRPRLGRVILGVVVAVATIATIGATLHLVADWRKQSQIIAALATEPLVQQAGTVIFVDRSAELNFSAREYSWYEYNGWMLTAFGDETRIGVPRAQVADVVDGEFTDFPYAERYGFADWTPTRDGVQVEIRSSEEASVMGLIFGGTTIELVVTPVADLADYEAGSAD
ncbi:MAG: hypothetical protein ABIQ01_10680 [Pseudolysinimonas sp.]